jgi:hypothetical protein
MEQNHRQGSEVKQLDDIKAEDIFHSQDGKREILCPALLREKIGRFRG